MFGKLFVALSALALAGCAGSAAKSSSSSPGSRDQMAYATPAEAAGGASGRVIPAAALSGLVPASVSKPEDYRLGALDTVSVNVFGVEEMTGDFQVSPAGAISFPLIGTVPASGMTTQQLQATLTKKLAADYLQSPQVSVAVKDYNSQRVTVDGSVAKPGVYPITGTSTLLQALAQAGGPDRYSDPQSVLIFRNVGAQRTVARFDVTQLRAGKAEDPAIKAGDVVVVPESSMKVGARDWLQFLPVAGLFAAVL
ncbi:polysaccharide biosynthesis/export family protein [Ancylobacter lacus]|uniref:polysaccharide biosynthesis/export family protein n=1 Tax=Ancylobacter lacus TaxID=2579970 RepID=UPI001BD07BBA|nr:polysaccharide biosynthesis/export family protein [Ancylobacter lacus]MBS7539994.1 polysaccharide export protein [Ancylobacter lacus]